MKLIVFKYQWVITLLLLVFYQDAFAESVLSEGNSKILLSRLDLSQTDLLLVKQNKDNPELAVRYLLEYFKTRNSVKHPISKDAKSEYLGNYADSTDLVVADNALKHIFVGQRAYSPFFCGEDIDWGMRPVPDNEWVWQLNRMYFWDSMAKTYWHTGNEKYAKEWCSQLIDWTRKNPNDKEHEYAWRSIEAGIRGHSWMGFYQHFILSPNFNSEVLVAFLNSCYDHAEYLMTKYRTGSNWGLMEAEGMAFIATTFPEFKDAEKWRDEAFRRLNIEITKQVYPDGHQRELAMGYHLGCINWFLRTYELAKLNNMENTFSESYLERIEKMCEVPMKLCLPDGTNVQFGDAWQGKPGQHAEQFLEWSKLFNRSDFLYLATDGEEGQRPDSTAYALPYSGLYSMRSGWDKEAICMVLKCGPDGGGHCQPDNGTFDIYAGGRNLMPDAGSYIYSGDPEGRSWFRQTKVHQTLTLNGENSDYVPTLLLWKPGENTDILVVENQSYEKLKHRRSVFFVDKKYFVVVDEAIGEATGDVGIHFQLAPESEAVFSNRDMTFQTNLKEGWNIYVQSQKQPEMNLEKEEGWVSFEYTRKEPRPAFQYKIQKKDANQKITFYTLVIPFKNRIPKVEIVANKAKSAGELQFEIIENGKRKSFGYKL